jgi:hypothetical protein
MMGHFVARSVKRERVGKRGEEEVQRVRRVEVFVLPKKGQECLKREREDSLSIMQNWLGGGMLEDGGRAWSCRGPVKIRVKLGKADWAHHQINVISVNDYRP